MATPGGFDPSKAAGRDTGIFGLSFSTRDAKVVLLPVPWEATVSYGGGTARGPGAILRASRQIDLFDLDLGNLYEAGIALDSEPDDVSDWNREASRLTEKVRALDEAAGADPEGAADRRRVNELSALMNRAVYERASRWMDAGKVLGVVGGDHSSPFGAIQAAGERWNNLGILHLDAHSDTRHRFEGFEWSHASIMENVLRHVPSVTRLVQVGIRDFCEEEHLRCASEGDRVAVFHGPRLARERFEGRTWRQQVEELLAPLPEEVWLSYDIDGLDPSYCPHTGTPVPGGLTFDQAVYMTSELVRSGRRIAGFDLCEVAPGPEDDEWDANVGARLLYKMSLWALASRR